MRTAPRRRAAERIRGSAAGTSRTEPASAVRPLQHDEGTRSDGHALAGLVGRRLVLHVLHGVYSSWQCLYVLVERQGKVDWRVIGSVGDQKRVVGDPLTAVVAVGNALAVDRHRDRPAE